MHKLDQSKLSEFMGALCKGRAVFAIEKSQLTLPRSSETPSNSRLRLEATDGQAEEQYHLVRADMWDPERHTLGPYRPVEPLKSLVFQPREFLGSLASPSETPSLQERIVIGVKNCDLSALKIYDHVFLESEPVADPFYTEARNKTILVSCDCSDALDVCFCPVVNQQPYAKEGFDINISPTSQGFVIETGTGKGKRILSQAEGMLKPADESIIKERDKNRSDIARRVADQAVAAGLRSGTDFRKAIQRTAESDLWDGIAENCVECGACNFVCCTCHCFLLADGMSRNKLPARVKQWDSCLYKNFARVAGGANPRKHRAERLYNRFDKKFNFFPEVLGIYACDGCGRCIEACAGKIDIREVLGKAVENTERGARNAE